MGSDAGGVGRGLCPEAGGGLNAQIRGSFKAAGVVGGYDLGGNARITVPIASGGSSGAGYHIGKNDTLKVTGTIELNVGKSVGSNTSGAGVSGGIELDVSATLQMKDGKVHARIDSVGATAIADAAVSGKVAEVINTLSSAAGIAKDKIASAFSSSKGITSSSEVQLSEVTSAFENAPDAAVASAGEHVSVDLAVDEATGYVSVKIDPKTESSLQQAAADVFEQPASAGPAAVTVVSDDGPKAKGQAFAIGEVAVGARWVNSDFAASSYPKEVKSGFRHEGGKPDQVAIMVREMAGGKFSYGTKAFNGDVRVYEVASAGIGISLSPAGVNTLDSNFSGWGGA